MKTAERSESYLLASNRHVVGYFSPSPPHACRFLLISLHQGSRVSVAVAALAIARFIPNRIDAI
jgi:hypothetical protein